MQENYQKLKNRSYFAVFLLSLISFVLLYLRISYVFESAFSIYCSYFFQYFIDSLVPALIASVLFSAHGCEGHGKRLLSALKQNLPRLVYLIPYGYLYYMSDGYDSFDSLSLTALRCCFMLAVFTLEVYLYTFAARFAASRKNTEYDFYSYSSCFDLSSAVPAGIFAICFARFIVNVISEAFDAVMYFIDYGESYSIDDILFMLAKFVLALISLLLSQLIIGFIRKRHIRRCERALAEAKESEEE